MAGSDIKLSPQAAEHMKQGRMIEAIKVLRHEHPGLGLKEAKDAVEAWLAAHPELKPRRSAVQRDRIDAGRVITIALGIVTVILVWLKVSGRF